VSTTTAVINGALGGLVATLAMTVAMVAVGDDSPPPTADLWSKYVGGKPAENRLPAMLLHFLYGAVVAGVLAAVLSVTGLTDAVINFGSGVAYGVVLFIVGALFWVRLVLGMDPERKQTVTFLMVHFVYGAVLGAWLAANLL
jgi:hypothetical protein